MLWFSVGGLGEYKTTAVLWQSEQLMVNTGHFDIWKCYSVWVIIFRARQSRSGIFTHHVWGSWLPAPWVNHKVDNDHVDYVDHVDHVDHVDLADHVDNKWLSKKITARFPNLLILTSVQMMIPTMTARSLLVGWQCALCPTLLQTCGSRVSSFEQLEIR